MWLAWYLYISTHICWGICQHIHFLTEKGTLEHYLEHLAFFNLLPSCSSFSAILFCPTMSNSQTETTAAPIVDLGHWLFQGKERKTVIHGCETWKILMGDCSRWCLCMKFKCDWRRQTSWREWNVWSYILKCVRWLSELVATESRHRYSGWNLGMNHGIRSWWPCIYAWKHMKLGW